MKKNVAISVSTDPIEDFQEVVEYARELQGISDFLHCDIMDGKFVPKKTYTDTVVESINQNCLTMLDVHLMVDEPTNVLDDYIEAGANILTVHYEAFEDKEKLHKALEYIKKNNTLVGLSFKPDTHFKDIKMFCYDIDVLLVMSVEPGASGQKLLPDTFAKIKEIAKFRDANNLNFKIEIDGGVNEENAGELVDAGADILVSGNYVYKAKDRAKAINTLRG